MPAAAAAARSQTDRFVVRCFRPTDITERNIRAMPTYYVVTIPIVPAVSQIVPSLFRSFLFQS